MTDSHLSDSEYTALRHEVVFLIQIGFDIWKWSLLAAFALAGAMILTAFGDSTALSTLIVDRPWLLTAAVTIAVAAEAMSERAGVVVDHPMAPGVAERIESLRALIPQQQLEALVSSGSALSPAEILAMWSSS